MFSSLNLGPDLSRRPDTEMSTRFQALGNSAAIIPLQHLMSGFQESPTSIGCLSSVSVSSEAVSEMSPFAGALGSFSPLSFPSASLSVD